MKQANHKRYDTVHEAVTAAVTNGVTIEGMFGWDDLAAEHAIYNEVNEWRSQLNKDKYQLYRISNLREI
jgi:hypothetical protein